MRDERKTKAQLLDELKAARARAGELEAAVAECRRSEEGLRDSEARHRLLGDKAADLLWTVDMDMRVTYMSPSVARILGFTVDEAMARAMREAYTPDSFSRAMKALEEELAIERGGSKDKDRTRKLEIELTRKDGSILPTEVNFSFLRKPDGQPCGILAIARDISERRRAEKALKESEERFRIGASSVSDLVWDWDLASHRLEWFGNVDELLGYAPDEFPRTIEAWKEAIHPDDHHEVMAILERHLKTSEPYLAEYRIRRKDGECLCWIDSGAAMRDEEGEPYRMVGACRDVTEEKMAEEALLETEERQRALMNAITESALLIDAHGTILAANQTSARRLGASPEDLIGSCVYDCFAPDVAELRRSRVREVLSTGRPVQFEDMRDGRIIDSTMHPVFRGECEVTAVAIFAADVTERRETEEARQKSESLYRTLAEASPDMIFVIDREDRVQYLNSAAARYVGQRLEDAVGRPRAELFPPPIAERQKGRLCEVLETGQTLSTQEETPFPGRTAWLNTWLVPLRDEAGNAHSVLGIARDVTNVKQAERALLESERVYRTLAENLPGIVYRLSLGEQGRVEFFNSMVEPMTGYEPTELIAGDLCPLESLLVPEDRESVIASVRRAVEDDRPFRVEYRLTHKDGSLRSFSERARPLRGADGKPSHIDGVILDITERKQAEDELREANRRLEEVLARINTLHGLLPICAHCKRIRDDQGYWQQVEEYVKQRSDADFSHGICPQCLNALYPDVYKRMCENGELEV